MPEDKINMQTKRVASLELANYILAQIGKMNHLKLQKLVYYAEAYHLAYFNQSIISDDFQAWLHGPVSRKLWDLFKLRANIYDNIPTPKDGPLLIKKFRERITEDQLELIDDVIKEFGKLSAYRLECLTHSEKPWKSARKGYVDADKCEVIINKEEMKKYYKKNLYRA